MNIDTRDPACREFVAILADILTAPTVPAPQQADEEGVDGELSDALLLLRIRRIRNKEEEP